MEPDGDSPPMWSQPTTTLLRQRRRQPPSPPIINPVVLILLLPILTLLVLFFLVPPFLSHSTQILRPNSVKKGWDSFNILLVVFAILCGVFARKNEDSTSPVERNRIVSTSDHSSNFNYGETRENISNDRWFEPSEEKSYNFAPIGLPETGVNRLRRSSSSYPDLRQVPQWETGENQSRFYDDFGVNLYRPAAEYDSHRPLRREEPDVKVIPVDTFEICSSPPEPSTPEKPPVTLSKPPQANLKRTRSFHSVSRKDKVEMQSNETEVELNEKLEPPPPPSPPSLPKGLSPPVEKPQKLQQRKSGTKELATAVASLYNQSKRKRRTKKRDIFEGVSDSPPSAEQVLPPATPPPPPPPPPPLPPSKVFQNLFKKNRKSKRVHSDPSNVPAPPPPPPPPPPPNSIFNNLFKTGSKSKRFQQTTSSTPPPPPPPPPPSSILNNLFKHGTKSRRFKSPISTPTPPPPPPPPPPQAHVSSRWRRSPSHSQPPEPPRRRSSSSSKPPLPTKPVSSYYDDNLNSGSQSPLIRMPPPPPPPPFKMREMNFVPTGDFFRIWNAHSSRCTSPEIEDVDVDHVSVRSSSEVMDGGDLTGPSVTCPSPDVNVKAATFIARLRDEWRLEKMNSFREKSTLG
ncbi:hypothetical protein RND71_042432 [Anisodus tanguticus]|uniref:Uncharacterized protein n=1 Tax=Anisodus tanguticus TaxID=243964 RepID=A0AAE1UUM6_9SOLA|nr:hypothetical protein RND71_042432 [Anisodus tanguticus]